MIFIERPISEDAYGIQNVFFKTWLSTYPNTEIGITIEDITVWFKDALSEDSISKRILKIMNPQKGEIFFVAKDKTEVIGVCLAIIGEVNIQLQAIYVLPNFQNQGIGSMLWKKTMENLDSTKPIYVSVAEYNSNAISFYQKVGFVKTGKHYSRITMPVSGVSIPEIEMILLK